MTQESYEGSTLGPGAAAALPTAADTAPGRDPNIHIWADAAADALWFNAYTSATGYFSDGWGFAQAFDILTDNARRTAGCNHTDKLIQLVERYDAISYSPFSPTYYDDHAWMALALVRAANHLGQTPALAAQANLAWAGARNEYAIIKQGYDPSTQRIFWTSDRSNWVTASTATTSMVACAFFETSGQNPCDLTLAKALYDSWRQTIFDPNTGVVNDGVDKSNNQLGTGQYTYNYGTLKGAALCLHRNTGIASYLDDARTMAKHELGAMTAVAGNDVVYTEPGCVSSACTGDGALFKGVGMRYFATLSRLDASDANILAALHGSAHAIYSTGRSGTQLSSVWQLPPFSADGQAAQTSAGMALAAVAEDATGSPQARVAGLFYEAENQNLVGLARMAGGTGASGLGFVDSVATDNTGIIFEVITPLAGPHRLVFRLASTQAGMRTVQVANTYTQLSFAASDGLGQFATASVDVALSAGLNRVTLLFSAARGSTQEAYVDSLSVHPILGTAPGTTLPPVTAPIAPVDGAGVAGAVSFSWQPVPQADSYQLIVDDVPLAKVASPSTSTVVNANALTNGAHRWYVLASIGQVTTASTQGSFTSCNTDPTPISAFTLTDSAAGLVVGWPALAARGCLTASVMFAGVVRCSTLNASQCILPNVTKADISDNLVVRVANAAHQLTMSVAADGSSTLAL